MVEDYQSRREALKRCADVRFVDREEFLRLIVSPHKLARADEPRCFVRGLYDEISHLRIMIEEERLYRTQFLVG